MGEVKELESFRWNRKISRIYDKGSVGETDSKPGAKRCFWKENNVLIFT